MLTKNAIAFRLVVFCCLASCSPRGMVYHDPPKGNPPDKLLGEFVDDYDITYSISTTVWYQYPKSKYRVVLWRPDAQFLIAQNDAAHPSDPGLWTRIDWIELPEMAPYEWAFCLSAYKAQSAAEAESTNIARRESPMTGCNGYPFSRMRRKGI